MSKHISATLSKLRTNRGANSATYNTDGDAHMQANKSKDADIPRCGQFVLELGVGLLQWRRFV